MHFTASDWISIISAIASAIVLVRHNWLADRVSNIETHTGISKPTRSKGTK